MTTPSSEYRAKWLQPCGAKTGTAELSACLVLVAPTGMRESERKAWLAVARQTLRGMPEDLLKRGCENARRYADHPNKVVPLIIAESWDAWEKRKRTAAQIDEEERPRLAPPEPQAVPHEVTQRILKEAREAAGIAE